MKTNKNQLVIQSVVGRIHHPTTSGARVGFNGQGVLLPGVGGITYNFQIGDNCMHLIGDHVEPGLSIANADPKENLALNTFACIGNTATILTGDAKGKTGIVTGIHGGVNHVMVYVDPQTLAQVNINDQIKIKAVGQGLKLLDYPEITWMNIDPHLVEMMDNQQIFRSEIFIFNVAKIIPAQYMGAGIGETTLLYGDIDIMIQDEQAKADLIDLRFGDFVAIMDFDTRYGAYYNQAYVSIGVICHSDSFTSGHGPGVTIIACAHQDDIHVQIDENANLAYYYRNHEDDMVY